MSEEYEDEEGTIFDLMPNLDLETLVEYLKGKLGKFNDERGHCENCRGAKSFKVTKDLMLENGMEDNDIVDYLEQLQQNFDCDCEILYEFGDF